MTTHTHTNTFFGNTAVLSAVGNHRVLVSRRAADYWRRMYWWNILILSTITAMCGFLTDGPSFLAFSSDRRMLLCGMFSFDTEGPKDCLWWGHHRNLDTQEKEGNSEEKTGTPLHQLLPDHVMTWTCRSFSTLQKPNLNCQQMTEVKRAACWAWWALVLSCCAAGI